MNDGKNGDEIVATTSGLETINEEIKATVAKIPSRAAAKSQPAQKKVKTVRKSMKYCHLDGNCKTIIQKIGFD